MAKIYWRERRPSWDDRDPTAARIVVILMDVVQSIFAFSTSKVRLQEDIERVLWMHGNHLELLLFCRKFIGVGDNHSNYWGFNYLVRYIQRREEDVTKWSFSINLRFHRMKDEDVRRHGIGSLYACKPPATFIIAECTLHSQIAILYLFYSTPFSIVVA